MIRPEVMGWAAIFLIILFAFVLLPTHERFTDARGRETDVSPNAPPKPSWLGGQGSVPPIDTSTAPTSVTGVGTSSNLVILPPPVSTAPRVTSTLGTTDPSISGMNGTYNSGIIPPSGSPWEGIRGLKTEMASVPTNPAFNPQTHPTPPLGTLSPVEPDMGLFGPGPNVLRKNLVPCTCASQAAGCSVHPRQ